MSIAELIPEYEDICGSVEDKESNELRTRSALNPDADPPKDNISIEVCVSNFRCVIYCANLMQHVLQYLIQTHLNWGRQQLQRWERIFSLIEPSFKSSRMSYQSSSPILRRIGDETLSWRKFTDWRELSLLEFHTKVRSTWFDWYKARRSILFMINPKLLTNAYRIFFIRFSSRQWKSQCCSWLLSNTPWNFCTIYPVPFRSSPLRGRLSFRRRGRASMSSTYTMETLEQGASYNNNTGHLSSHCGCRRPQEVCNP